MYFPSDFQQRSSMNKGCSYFTSCIALVHWLKPLSKLNTSGERGYPGLIGERVGSFIRMLAISFSWSPVLWVKEENLSLHSFLGVFLFVLFVYLVNGFSMLSKLFFTFLGDGPMDFTFFAFQYIHLQ